MVDRPQYINNSDTISPVFDLSVVKHLKGSEMVSSNKTETSKGYNYPTKDLNSGEDQRISILESIRVTKNEIENVQKDMYKYIFGQGQPTLEDLLNEEMLQKRERFLRSRLEILLDEQREEEERYIRLKNSEAQPKQSIRRATLSLSLEDVPRFQISSMNKEYFPGKEVYEDVASFATAYELFLVVTELDKNDGWKKFLALVFHPTFEFWVKEKLSLASTWQEGKKMIEEKFTSNITRGKNRLNVMFMKINEGESVEEYSMRFLTKATNAGFDSEDTTLGEVFLNGLPSEWYDFIYTNLNTDREDGSYIKTVEQVTKAAKRVSIPHFDQEGKRKFVGEARKFFCSAHGAYAADHNEDSCYSYQQGKRVRREYLENNSSTHKQQASPIANERTCIYCTKPFFRGHTCEAFYAKFPEKRPSVFGGKNAPLGSWQRNKLTPKPKNNNKNGGLSHPSRQ